MKQIFSLVAVCLFINASMHAQVKIGDNPTSIHPNSLLELESTNKGILFPRMTNAQRDAMASPAMGLMVFQTDGTKGVYFYEGTRWVNLTNGYTPNAKGEANSPSYGLVSTLAGSGNLGYADGAGAAATFSSPAGMATDDAGNIFVADEPSNRIRKITPAGVVTTFAGSGTAGSTDGTGTAASFNFPRGIAIDANGNLFVADRRSNKIRKITSDGVVSTFAGSGSAGATDGANTVASFNEPYGVAVDKSGNVYVADFVNNKIRRVTPGGVVSTLAGSGSSSAADGAGTAASFFGPMGVAVDEFKNVYVADAGNNEIRKITSAGVVTTFAGSIFPGSADGTGTAAKFSLPMAIALDFSGNLFVADRNNNMIRKITSDGMVTTLAGSGAIGSANGSGTNASFSNPSGVTTDADGNVYVSDSSNPKIRKIIAR